MLFDVDPENNASDRRSMQQQVVITMSGNDYYDSDDAEKELRPQSDNNIEHRTATADNTTSPNQNPSSRQSSSQLEYLNETLDDLAELWEQRLAEHRKQRQQNRNIETNIDSQLSTSTANGNYNNVESGTTTTICIPSQTKTTVDDGGCDHVSVTSSAAVVMEHCRSTANNNAVQEGSMSSDTTTNTNNTRVGRNRNQGGLFRNLSSPFASKKVLQE